MVNEPVFDPERGVWRGALESEYLSGRNAVDVLLPDRRRRGPPCRVVYALPCEAGDEHRFGDSITVLRELDAANRFGIIIGELVTAHRGRFAQPIKYLRRLVGRGVSPSRCLK